MNELFQPAQDQAPHAAPFMIMAAGAAAQQVNRIRVIEAVITACVSGAIIAATGYFLALPKLEEKVTQVREQMADLKSDLKEVRAEVRAISERAQRLEVEAARREFQRDTRSDRK